jgi:hypothetical protein
MFRSHAAIKVLSLSGLCATAVYYHLKVDVNDRYKSIFDHDVAKSYDVYYPRKKLVAEIQRSLSSNPDGLTYISGRMGAGKTSAVREALRDRNYVAHINWRAIGKITNHAKLVQTIKESFYVKQFKDYFRNFKLGWIMQFVLKLVPALDYSQQDATELSAVLNEIEAILRFRPAGVTQRPVIYIDEVANIVVTDDNREIVGLFFNWLIKVSRDLRLCDVIVSTADAFVNDSVSVIDPKYITIITVEDLTNEEISDMITSYRKDKNVKFPLSPEKIKYDVGGNMGEVKRFCEVNSEWEYAKRLMSSKQIERALFSKTLLQDAVKPSFFGKVPDDKFTGDQFKAIMNVFAKSDSSDPVIPLKLLLNESKVPVSVVKILVTGGTKYLYVDPLTDCVRVRSKLFLDAYKETLAKENRITSILNDIGKCESIRDDEDSLSEERIAAATKLKDLEAELKLL